MSKNGHQAKGVKMPEYATQKPVAIAPDGRFIAPSEAVDNLGRGIEALSSLDSSLQQKLVLERIKLDPKYDLAALDGAQYTKEEVLDHVEKQTPFGQLVISAEMNYCREYIAALSAPPKRPAPLPKIKPIEPIIPPQHHGKRIKIWIKNTVVFCESTTEDVTHNMAHYRIAHVHPVFVQQGFNVVNLEGIHDNRQEFAAAAKGAFVVYISGVGAGSPSAFCGYHNLPILQVGAYDPAEVKGKVIHLVGYQTARQLGPDLVAKGAKAYSGYYDHFIFINAPITTRELFWQCDSTFDICMARGYTVTQAHKATIAAYDTAIASAPNTKVATWLTWDRDRFRSPVVDPVYGDPAAKAPSKTAVWIPVPFTIADLIDAEHVHA